MKHPTMELASLADGELEPARARAVQAHLASCDVCRMQWERLGGIERRLQAVPHIEPAADFLSQIQTRVANLPAPQRLRLRWRIPAALLCVGMGWIVLILSTSYSVFLGLFQDAVARAPAWDDLAGWFGWLEGWSMQFEATIVLALRIATFGALLVVMHQLQTSGLNALHRPLQDRS